MKSTPGGGSGCLSHLSYIYTASRKNCLVYNPTSSISRQGNPEEGKREDICCTPFPEVALVNPLAPPPGCDVFSGIHHN